MKSIFELRRVIACSDTVYMMLDSVWVGTVNRYDGKWWHTDDHGGAVSGPFRSSRAACRDFERKLPERALALLVYQCRERAQKEADEFNARREKLRLPK